MPSLGTSPKAIANSKAPSTVVVHADSSNSDIIRVSWTTSDVSQYEELNRNESLYLYNYQGMVHAVAKSGTQKYTAQVMGASGAVVS